MIVLALWAIATGANLTKAVHIDDTGHLVIAERIQAEPLHVMSGLLNWGDVPEPIHVTNQPHLFFYLLAAWLSMAGNADAPLHVLMSLVSLGTIISFFRLAGEIAPGDESWLGALLFTGPAFLPSQNLMVDVPLLCLSLLVVLGLALALKRRNGGWILASVSCALAILTKYTAIALLPLLAGAALALRGRRGLWVLIIPLFAIAAWSALNLWDYGGIHILERPAHDEMWVRAAKRAPQLLLCIGGVAPFSILIGRRLFSSSAECAAVAVASLLLGVMAAVYAMRSGGESGVTWSLALAAALFAANGFWLLAGTVTAALQALRANWDGRTALALGWLVSLGAFLIAFAPFMAVRHVLLIIPPVLLLIARLDDRWRQGVRPWIALVLSCSLGSALAVSDWVYADVYRDEATVLRRDLGTKSTVWFTGHWGWQWYARANGMREYATGMSRLRAGDFFVRPALVLGQVIPPSDLARLVRIKTISIDATPLTTFRTMSMEPWGGFYSSSMTSLPWRISRAPLEQFDIFQVQ